MKERVYHRAMAEEPTPTDEAAREGWERFQRLARALFRVDKRDVEKHHPVKRAARSRDGVSVESK